MCALTGMKITLNRNARYGRQTASLDRIDPEVGYVPGNIQWVHKDVNRLKQNFTEPYLLRLCELIIKERKRKAS
jgi:hypothetical protein